MKTTFASIGSIVFALTALAQEPRPSLCEPWQQPYAGADATGKHVIACWQGTNDISGHGLSAKLQGAVAATDARFGACIESFCGHPVEDKKHAAVVANHLALTPKGAFTIEMWIRPKKELADYPDAFLLDKKYVAHSDYQMILAAADKGGSRRLAVHLGFGDDSERWLSEPAKYEAGTWYHVAFTYDGAGEGRFWRHGTALGGMKKPGRAAITPGKHPLSIGDRHGSLYHGFPGFIAQVRLCNGALEFRPAAFAVASDRTSFVRMEKAAPIRFTVTNLQRTKLKGATASVSLEGAGDKNFTLPELDGGASHALDYALDTSLRPGEYNLRARLRIVAERASVPTANAPSTPVGTLARSATPSYESEESFPITIVPRPLPQRMPVLMWGIGGTDHVIKELPRLKHIGFTHCLGMGADFGTIFDAGKPTVASKAETVADTKRMLNVALANDLGVCISLSPGNWAEHKKEFLRIDRQGKSNLQRPSICGLFPEMQKLCYNVGASVAQTYGEFPAWQAALLHTEVRDSAGLCYHEHDRAACRQATGADIPAEISGKWGVDRAKLKDFPADCIIRDDDPIYRYCQWYWKTGDGWNGLNNELHRGLKSTGRNDLWTFHDPAVRVASVYGSGGAVDVISQWTYSYPDPIRIGVATDELFAMARGADHPQRVMKMTQIIWYRSQTAPQQK
ncbi:MAG: LamG domain-containing protein, partial [Verrucomicrobia bacterium]|nr:LamG domain-containing protein [Verrucomicrobiota bacterium]